MQSMHGMKKPLNEPVTPFREAADYQVSRLKKCAAPLQETLSALERIRALDLGEVEALALDELLAAAPEIEAATEGAERSFRGLAKLLLAVERKLTRATEVANHP
jgi:hypothetical protein